MRIEREGERQHEKAHKRKRMRINEKVGRESVRERIKGKEPERQRERCTVAIDQCFLLNRVGKINPLPWGKKDAMVHTITPDHTLH